MEKRTEIPRKSIYRLSIYQRCLERLKINSVETVSSSALAKAAGVKSTQLRKDLAHFGQFGVRGLGYNVNALADVIVDVLGTSSLQAVVLVGMGNLGAAFSRYAGFGKEGFEISAAFEADPQRAKTVRAGVPVFPAVQMSAYVIENQVKMAILAVPGEVAQSVTNELVSSGVQAILNFSPIHLKVPDHVVVNSVDLALELEHLSYFIK